MKYMKDSYKVFLDSDHYKPEYIAALSCYRYQIQKQDLKRIPNMKKNEYVILNIDTIHHEVSTDYYDDYKHPEHMSNVYPIDTAIKSLKIHKMMEYLNNANESAQLLDEDYFKLLHEVTDNDTIDKILNKVDSGFYEFEFLDLLQFSIFKRANKPLICDVIVTEKADEIRLLEALERRNFMKNHIDSYNNDDPIGIVYEVDEANKVVTRKPATVVLENSDCKLYSARKYLEKTDHYELQHLAKPMKVIRQAITVHWMDFGYEPDIIEYEEELTQGDLLCIDNDGIIKDIQHRSSKPIYRDADNTFQYIIMDHNLKDLIEGNLLYKLEKTDLQKNLALEYEQEETFEL